MSKELLASEMTAREHIAAMLLASGKLNSHDIRSEHTCAICYAWSDQLLEARSVRKRFSEYEAEAAQQAAEHKRKEKLLQAGQKKRFEAVQAEDKPGKWLREPAAV